jgi:predicted TIM-barrel fold metal-dependent hydrolase
MVDWLYSGKFVQFPRLKVALAECQIGWIPFYLERADETWEIHRGWAGVRDLVPERPSNYFKTNMWVTYFSDPFGLSNLDAIGVDRVMVETDYPHSDTTWPDSRDLVSKQTKHLDDATRTAIVRDNARALFRLD